MKQKSSLCWPNYFVDFCKNQRSALFLRILGAH
jgi:hypothetical protein